MNDMREEVWVDVMGYDGKYQVSDLGRIRSCKRSKSKKKWPYIIRKLKSTGGNYPYLQIELWKNNTRKFFLVGRIVAMHFVEAPGNFDDYEVNHEDRNRFNNRADNLTWMTKLENAAHRDGKVSKFIYVDLDEDLEDPFGDRRIRYHMLGVMV